MENKRHRIPVVNQSYMRSQQQQNIQLMRKKKGLIRRLSVFFTIAFLLVFFLVKTLQAQGELLQSKKEQLKTIEAELEQMKNTQSVLEEEILKLQDDEYIGKYARQEYFLSDDGEIIFSIPNEEDEKNVD
ncbi:FtsB family cell division protein [Fervidibacillus halotolerans]|uniref:Septum formation initiator family protein n=1 Tax=Fervidibacillus halotolerans TaxID=2980027 RepID=A0A9E8LZB5_9BACI|nr:septum formation initiator family protein [Fervidibacillus halotolerans]WAA12349.1 septum formation initiator family protein [Fervidibacillus halotolerans]